MNYSRSYVSRLLVTVNNIARLVVVPLRVRTRQNIIGKKHKKSALTTIRKENNQVKVLHRHGVGNLLVAIVAVARRRTIATTVALIAKARLQNVQH